MPRHRQLRHHPRHGHPEMAAASTMEPYVCLWMLRLLVGARIRDRLGRLPAHWGHLELDSLGVELPSGEEHWADFTPNEFDAAIGRRLEALKSDPQVEPEGRLVDNVSALAERLRLNPTERSILLLMALLTLDEDLGELFRTILHEARLDAAQGLSLALDLDEAVVREAVRPDATLSRSGLLYLEPRIGRRLSFGQEHEMLPGLAMELMGPGVSLEAVFQSYFRPSPLPDDSMVDFPHLERRSRDLVALLRSASGQRLRGINILLYGAPGTGKTVLARRIAQLAGLDAVEVNDEDRSGRPHSPRSRQRAYQFCQHVMARDETALIIFDEIEDVFNDVVHLGREDRVGGKAWTNHMLETNAVPAIWITNDVRPIRAAYLRRFTETLELRPPPRSALASLLRRACTGLPVTETWISRTAAIQGLTPADIHKAAQVAHLVQGDGGAVDVEARLDAHFERSAQLQGRPIPARRRHANLIEYDIDLLNPDQDLAPILKTLTETGEGGLLIHGLPGTGKTGLAEHIASVADRPLLARPASAVLSPFVGMTERNIAALFAEASDEGAVLLVDEADSLLTSRESARARWELTQTNELLVQIEHFPGILIFATNFLSALDVAALRRFDFKLELRPIGLEQRMTLLKRLTSSLKIAEPSDVNQVRRVVSSLNQLTPGDFAAVARRFRNASDADGLAIEKILFLLEREERMKREPMRARVGFT